MTEILFSFVRHLNDLINISILSPMERQLVFYSEGQNYWVHLEGLIREILSISSIKICYVSSSSRDPGLRLDHPNYRSFEVGNGFARDWFFSNINAAVMVMTMPDLHQYQVKKSKYDVHYIYVQHSLVSLLHFQKPLYLFVKFLEVPYL